MKKILFVLIGILFIYACDNTKSANTKLSNDYIYFFYHTNCIYCHKAINYINKKYPSLNMKIHNIENQNSYKLFIECATKFNLGNNVGTPLLCMGDKYIMGWGDEYEKNFDDYVKPFLYISSKNHP